MWGGSTGGQPWGLTTTFDGYGSGSPDGIFNTGQIYIVALIVSNCPCNADTYTYQLTYDSQRLAMDPEYQKKYKEISSQMEGILETEATNLIKGDFEAVEFMSHSAAPSSNDSKMIDFAGKQFEVFPNPARNVVTISAEPGAERSEFHLVDAAGKIIRSWTSDEYIQKLDVRELPQGMYYLRLNRDGEVLTEKIIKTE